MFSTKGNRVLIVIIMVLLFCLLSACGTNQRPGPTTPDNQPPQAQNQPNDDQNRSQEISRKLEQEVEEINSATVIITGNQAWVGVDAKANAQISDQTKEKISNIVKKEDQGIQTVYVAADADTVTRLRNIANDIANGKPISGFLNELAEIANRIAPEPR